MKHSQKGYIIFAVLLLLQACTLLELYTLQHMASMLKQSDAFWQRQIYVSMMDKLLSQIENSLFTNKAWCRVPLMSAETVAKKPLVWWQIYACSGNFYKIQYYDAIEYLGRDTCSAVMKNNALQAVTMDYYRVTLLAFPDEIKRVKIILQTTVSFISDLTLPCRETLHVVKPGRQMWREI